MPSIMPRAVLQTRPILSAFALLLSACGTHKPIPPSHPSPPPTSTVAAPIAPVENPAQSRVPRIRVGSMQSSGSVEPAELQKVMRSNLDGLRQCYEAALASSPDLVARVTIRFIIRRKGDVSNVSNTSRDVPEILTRCVAHKINGLTFPAPTRGIVSVILPLKFDLVDASSPATRNP